MAIFQVSRPVRSYQATFHNLAQVHFAVPIVKNFYASVLDQLTSKSIIIVIIFLAYRMMNLHRALLFERGLLPIHSIDRLKDSKMRSYLFLSQDCDLGFWPLLFIEISVKHDPLNEFTY